MTDNLLQKWLAYYDPIHRGWTPRGVANGICATGGWFFPRILGGYNLRRSQGQVPGQDEIIVGAAGAQADSIRTFPWVSHTADESYIYRLTAVGGGGVENFQDEIVTQVWLDETGNWPGCRPNAPSDLRVSSLSGGRFVLKWIYLGEGEQA